MANALEISNLVKVYDNGFKALNGIDLTVPQGDFFALLGPNGAGKSTSLGIVSSLVNKTSGTVKVNGFDLDSQREQVKRSLGVVPQEFNFNAFEKVLDIVVQQAGYYGLPRKLALTRAETYLKQLDLWEKRDTAARMLSGGMKRRLMIARALVHEPKILILDEPTAGVDIEIRRSMWRFLNELNRQGTTIILTTHYLEEAETLCPNLAIIGKGNIIAQGPTKALLKDKDRSTFVADFTASITELPPTLVSDYGATLVEGGSIEFHTRQGQTLNEVFACFNEHDLEAISIRPKTNRLEELFVDLTTESE
ncbi:ABC transporter ATP-binding protein [Reinekea blandensis]|uniref:Probable ATP-binding component of ABC transporter n=1 Tax=Reinekea blandensis MED297 TaxID=314283 RepID=A4BGN6_9GAMM|nr:ABC transporter ATP-binding protein [Reinekea blandensis]EAR08684.1 probable ATP-binding component of ABC transporter [Reinekea sp. MED297] [Reinekea blandensis MED297]